VVSDRLERAYAEWLAGRDDGAFEEELRRQPEAESKLRRGIDSLEAIGLLGEDDSAAVPQHLPGYRLDRTLGSGGMGVVYHARGDDGRSCAVKFLRPTLTLFPESRLRFLREVHIMSRLDHPGIVRVLDFGIANGMPWFAMELLEGVTLDVVADGAPGDGSGRAFAEAAGLAAPLADTWEGSCVAVARQIGDALACAHAERIVHRDVKPGNVMLLPDGRAIVLDFGLAFAAEATSVTTTATAIGSLPYLAPERLEDSTAAPDARVDVYAFGVLLYELISGRRPFVGADRRAVERAIAVGHAPDLHRVVPGTTSAVSAICAQAMRVQPEERYADAGEMLADLDRAVAGVAVRARPTSRRARLTATLRAHPGRTAAAVAGGALAASLAIVSWTEATAAERHRPEVTVVEERAPAALVARSKEVFAGGLSWLETVAQRAPVQRALGLAGSVVLDMSGTHAGRHGDFAQSLAAHERALELALICGSAQRVTESMHCKAIALGRLGRDDEAMALHREVIERRRGEGLAVPLIGSLGDAVGLLRSLGRIEEADPLLREAMALAEAELGADHPRTLGMQHRYGRVLAEGRRYEEARGVLESLVEIYRERAHDDELSFARVLSDLGTVQLAMGDVDLAEASLRQALQIQIECGDESNLAATYSNLAALLGKYRGDFQSAVEMAERAADIEVARRPAHITTAQALQYVGSARQRAGDLDGALDAYAESRAIAINKPGHSVLIALDLNCGYARYQQGDFARAETAFRDLLGRLVRDGQQESYYAAVGHHQLAKCLNRMRDHEVALEHASKAVDIFEKVRSSTHPKLEEFLNVLGMTESLAGRPAPAAVHYQRAITLRDARVPEGDDRTAEFECELGRALFDLGQPADAMPHLQRAVALRARHFGEEEYRTIEAEGLLGEAMAGAGVDPERAQELMSRAAERLTAILGADDERAQRASKALTAR